MLSGTRASAPNRDLMPRPTLRAMEGQAADGSSLDTPTGTATASPEPPAKATSPFVARARKANAVTANEVYARWRIS